MPITSHSENAKPERPTDILKNLILQIDPDQIWESINICGWYDEKSSLSKQGDCKRVFNYFSQKEYLTISHKTNTKYTQSDYSQCMKQERRSKSQFSRAATNGCKEIFL